MGLEILYSLEVSTAKVPVARTRRFSFGHSVFMVMNVVHYADLFACEPSIAVFRAKLLNSGIFAVLNIIYAVKPMS